MRVCWTIPVIAGEYIRNIIAVLISVKAQHDREIVLNVYDSGLLYHDMFKTQALNITIPYHNYQNFIRN